MPIFRNASTRLGWQVQPEFVVVQGERSVRVLHELKSFFGCGTVGINRRFDDHREDMWRFSVKSLVSLHRVIIPFFELYPLRTAKREDFGKFCAVVALMQRGVHLNAAGMGEIARIAQSMNRRKPSRFLESSEDSRKRDGRL